jgi:hypothetical protein
VEPIYRFYGHLISLKIVVVVVETLMMYEDGSLWDQLFGMNELLFLVESWLWHLGIAFPSRTCVMVMEGAIIMASSLAPATSDAHCST